MVSKKTCRFMIINLHGFKPTEKVTYDAYIPVLYAFVIVCGFSFFVFLFFLLPAPGDSPEALSTTLRVVINIY